MLPATLSELVDYSNKTHVGVGMFNIVNMEFMQAIYDAAQESGYPVMLGIPERFMLNFYSGDCMALACRKLIEGSKVPIAIHLDHGKSFAGVMAAIKAGFSSVMFDGSLLPYEENVTQTAEIVKIAHSMGVSVEGELGYVGRSGVDAIESSGFTEPAQAVDFVQRTGVDALAIAIGNQHGLYKGEPKLDFKRLGEIRSKVDCGLVLHGGTGIAEADFVQAIKAGINKVNIYTAMDVAVREFNISNFSKYATYLDYTKDLQVVVKEVVLSHMLLFAGKRQPQ